MLRLEFNEVTFVTNDRIRDNSLDYSVYNHDRFYDERFDRYRQDDRNIQHDKYGHDDRYRSGYSDTGLMVQVYGLGLEYGFVSQSLAQTPDGLPLTGVKINLDNAQYR